MCLTRHPRPRGARFPLPAPSFPSPSLGRPFPVHFSISRVHVWQDDPRCSSMVLAEKKNIRPSDVKPLLPSSTPLYFVFPPLAALVCAIRPHATLLRGLPGYCTEQ
eukprot:5284129-Pyramimonas_sp.AAC.1